MRIVGNWSAVCLLLGLLLFALSANCRANPGKVALVIGNADYDAYPLDNPVNDANDITRILVELGFEVIEGLDLDRRGLRLKIREFGQKLRRSEIGFFYYAGHGVQYQGENYLIPVRADVASQAEIADEAISVNSVLRQMDVAANKVNVIILDACRTNPFTRGFDMPNQGLAGMYGPAGSYIAYATAPGETASDGEGRNGLYTQYLLKYMKDTGLTVEQVMKKVRIAVSEVTHGQQIPWENSSLMGDYFFHADGYLPTAPQPIAGAGKVLEADQYPPLLGLSSPWHLAWLVLLVPAYFTILQVKRRAGVSPVSVVDPIPMEMPVPPVAVLPVEESAPKLPDPLPVLGYLVSMKDDKTVLEIREDSEWIIGRGEASDVQVERGDASRSHARVGWDKRKQHFWLEDLESTNGTGLLSENGDVQFIPAMQRIRIESEQAFCIIDAETAFRLKTEQGACGTATVVASMTPKEFMEKRKVPAQAATVMTTKKAVVRDAHTKKVLALVTPSHSVLIGRKDDLDISIKKPEISGRHAELRWDADGECCQVRDLGTLNGTWMPDAGPSQRRRLPANEFVRVDHEGEFFLADRENSFVIVYI